MNPFACLDLLVPAAVLLLDWLVGRVDLVLRMADLALLSAYKPNPARRRLGRHCEDREDSHCPHDVQCSPLSGSGAGAVGHS